MFKSPSKNPTLKFLRAFLFVFPIILLHKNVYPACQDFNIIEVPISLSIKKIQVKSILNEGILYSGTNNSMVIFANKRKIWVKRKNGKIEIFQSKEKPPFEYDYVSGICNSGNIIIISLWLYSPEYEQADKNKPRGAFVIGPDPAGFIIIRNNNIKYVKELTIKLNDDQKKDVNLQYSFKDDQKIIPEIQSCYIDSNNFLIGFYGGILNINSNDNVASVIDYDDGMTFNRFEILKIGNSIWNIFDEGGLDGGCIEEKNKRNRNTYCLLGKNNLEIKPDKLVYFNQLIFASSITGVVAIDKNNKNYIHYKFSNNDNDMSVYNLKIIDNNLWGVRKDGLISFDLQRKKAILYQFYDDRISNDIYEITKFNGKWYVATKNQLVEIIWEKNR